MPFEVPSSWVWTTLGEGITIKSGDNINVRDNKVGKYPIYGGNGINGYFDNYNVETDTIVIGRVGFNCGSIHQTKSKAWVTDNAFIVSFENIFYPTYLCFLLKWLQLSKTSNSTAQPVISGKGIYPLFVPIPPFDEQNRIAEEIDHWFSLIDKIEQEKIDLQSIIKQTKSKILDLAIHGKLVPQDPSDEPASELLKRINPKAEITCDNGQYGKMPEGWIMCRIGDLFDVVSAKRVLKSDWTNKGIPFYRAREIVQLHKEGIADKDLFITEDLFAELKDKFGTPNVGDIMLSAVGSIGYTYIVNEEDSFYYKDASVLCLRNVNKLNSQYFSILFETTFVKEQMHDNSKGTTVDTITIENLKKYFVPLPPPYEQHRIVAKIKELFSSLDNIQKALEV